MLVVLLLAACGGDDDGGSGGDAGECCDASDPADPDAGDGEGACGPARQQARYRVTSTAEHGGVYGAWDDRPFPAPDEREVEQGGCFFVGPVPYFCDPVCEGNTICGTGNTCHPLPMTIPVGTLHIAGTDPELDLEPQPGNSYYTMEDYPGLYQPGDLVTVSGGGGDSDVEPFEISARGVPELTVPWDMLTAVEHEDMRVAWDVAEGSPDGAQVLLHMDSDHHGTRAYAECWSDDDGELVVPAAVLDPLILAGESGIGTYIENAYMIRLHRGTVETEAGCAVLDGEFNLNVAVETVRAE